MSVSQSWNNNCCYYHASFSDWGESGGIVTCKNQNKDDSPTASECTDIQVQTESGLATLQGVSSPCINIGWNNQNIPPNCHLLPNADIKYRCNGHMCEPVDLSDLSDLSDAMALDECLKKCPPATTINYANFLCDNYCSKQHGMNGMNNIKLKCTTQGKVQCECFDTNHPECSECLGITTGDCAGCDNYVASGEVEAPFCMKCACLHENDNSCVSRTDQEGQPCNTYIEDSCMCSDGTSEQFDEKTWSTVV